MSFWYESLESQLKWEHYNKLIKIVQPSAEDLRNLIEVRANSEPKRELVKPNHKLKGENDG